MTRSFIRSIIIQASIFVAISLSFLLTNHLIIIYRENDTLQNRLREEMSDHIVADHFSVLSSDEYEHFSGIKSVIVAYDQLGRPLSYIIDVHVMSDSSVLDMRLFLSDDAETIIVIDILNIEAEELPSEQKMNELLAQFENARIPVALSSIYEEEYSAQNEYNLIPGLHDGIFYAEMDTFNSAGYKDFVMIKVVGGRIVDVTWDAFSLDQGKNRAQASVDGEFPMPEGQAIWAAQAFAVENKLVEVQNPLYLAVRSDGRTEMIENVELNLQIFIKLVNSCIEDSLQNRTRTNLDDQEDSVESTNEIEEEVFALPSYTPIPTINTDASEQQSSRVVVSFEDGVVVSGYIESHVYDSVDGLLLSEIRTKIDGLEEHSVISSQVVSGVNEAYKFIRSYLRWGG